MAQRIYATAAEFETFTGGPADGTAEQVNAKLRRASIVIEGMTRLSVYPTDEDGMPSDLDHLEAFRDATCAQLDWWGDTDDVTGAESQAGPTKIGSVSFGGSGASGGAANTKSAATSRLAPEAAEILRNAGLISSAVSHS